MITQYTGWTKITNQISWKVLSKFYITLAWKIVAKLGFVTSKETSNCIIQ